MTGSKCADDNSEFLLPMVFLQSITHIADYLKRHVTLNNTEYEGLNIQLLSSMGRHEHAMRSTTNYCTQHKFSKGTWWTIVKSRLGSFSNTTIREIMDSSCRIIILENPRKWYERVRSLGLALQVLLFRALKVNAWEEVDREIA